MSMYFGSSTVPPLFCISISSGLWCTVAASRRLGVHREELALESTVVTDHDPDEGAGILVHGGCGSGLVIGAGGTWAAVGDGTQSVLALPIGSYGENPSDLITTCLEL